MKLFFAFLLAAVAITCGFYFQYKPYHTNTIGYGIQDPLDHRDSAYSSITWMISESDNFQQLKFFDRVEGGICLRPSWDDLITLANKDPTLRHLVPPAGTRAKPGKPGVDWPFSWQPDPGTVTNSPYIRLFPIGVLLNQAVMNKAGGDLQKADPKIMVVGLGSGIGIANLAHHFPNAAITVVDIDQVVEDMVRDHYPLLAWLLTQKLADGTPRLRFEVRDARQFIRYDAKRETKKYDLIVLDAYTSGSTIPPHLMTVEFFTQCADVLAEDGIVFANVIGSYTGDKRLVSGGAMRTFRAAGLTQLWNFPVLQPGEGPGTVDQKSSRNNIVVCSRKPLDPKGNAAGWERLKQFEPYPQLTHGSSVTSSYVLANSQKKLLISGLLPADLIDSALPNVKSRMKAQGAMPNILQYALTWTSDDHTIIESVMQAADDAVAKGKLKELPFGWDNRTEANWIERRETDWVLAARELFRVVVRVARDSNYGGEELVGPLEAERAAAGTPNWIITDAPLFTDQKPNADIFNN
jgi:Spermine/spermidine synthase domain